MFGGIYIWITLFDPNTRLLRNMFLFASVLGILAGIVAISEYIAAGPGRNYPDGTPRGIYLLSKQGEIITGMKNPNFIWGVIFLCCGLFLNVIYPFFYALSILCFVRLGSLKLTLRNLHKKSDRRIEKVLHKYYPSRDLEERLRKAGRPIPHNTVPYNDSEDFDENEEESEGEDLFDKIFFLIPAILGIIAIIFVFFNFYIHDGRFEKTTELDMSFRFSSYDASTDFTKEHFGRVYTLIPTDKELAEYRVYIKGLDHYGEFPELLEKHIDEKTVFHTISTFQDGERLQILQVSDKNGTVIFSTEACKQRRKDIALQWIKILIPITLGLTVVGRGTGYRGRGINRGRSL